MLDMSYERVCMFGVSEVCVLADVDCVCVCVCVCLCVYVLLPTDRVVEGTAAGHLPAGVLEQLREISWAHTEN